MNDYRYEVENWSRNELAAYNAHEQAQAGVDIGTVLKNLGRYDQGVVDDAAGVGKPKPTVKKAKKK
jgi:hypothetical protein